MLRKTVLEGIDLTFALLLNFLSSKIGSPPKTPVSHVAATSAGPSNVGTELSSVPPKSSAFLTRVPVYPQHSENIQYFQDPRTQIPFEVPQYPQTGESFQAFPRMGLNLYVVFLKTSEPLTLCLAYLHANSLRLGL